VLAAAAMDAEEYGSVMAEVEAVGARFVVASGPTSDQHGGPLSWYRESLAEFSNPGGCERIRSGYGDGKRNQCGKFADGGLALTELCQGNSIFLGGSGPRRLYEGATSPRRTSEG
jgi:hypothetical protein